uniref:Bm8160 n=1 Tax=Brugia malayi TaxID=6279 RepID=A0A1I9G8T4_BRUMA|nr:Bm8160 [Brugia malayi]
MTWSPRNRPGDDDDDDLGDIDASSEQNHSDRPCSSASDGDISVVINDTSEHDASGDIQSKSITPPLQSSCSEANINLPRLSSSSSTTTTITPTTTTTTTTVTTPRKTKIWSIAETLSSNTGEANSSNNCCIGYGSNKDDYERASTSVERKSWNDDQESMVQSDIASTMININQTIPSSSSSSTTLSSSSISQSLPLTSSLLPPNASTITAINGQIPHHFLQFHPWQQQQQQHQHHQHHHQQHHHHHQQQQQQLAMAMAIRMPFPRPELLTMMAQAGHIRSPMLFNPMFMGAIMPGISTTNHPIHSTHLSTTQSNNTLLTNG